MLKRRQIPQCRNTLILAKKQFYLHSVLVLVPPVDQRGIAPQRNCSRFFHYNRKLQSNQHTGWNKKLKVLSMTKTKSTSVLSPFIRLTYKKTHQKKTSGHKHNAARNQQKTQYTFTHILIYNNLYREDPLRDMNVQSGFSKNHVLTKLIDPKTQVFRLLCSLNLEPHNICSARHTNRS